MKICSKCGNNTNSDNATFCNKCGASLLGAQSVSKPKDSVKKTKSDTPPRHSEEQGGQSLSKVSPAREEQGGQSLSKVSPDRGKQGGIPLTLGAPSGKEKDGNEGNGNKSPKPFKKVILVVLGIIVALLLLMFGIGAMMNVDNDTFASEEEVTVDEPLVTQAIDSKRIKIVQFVGKRIDYYEIQIEGDNITIDKEKSQPDYQASDDQPNARRGEKENLETLISERLKGNIEYAFICSQNDSTNETVKVYNEVIKRMLPGRKIDFYKEGQYGAKSGEPFIEKYVKKVFIEGASS